MSAPNDSYEAFLKDVMRRTAVLLATMKQLPGHCIGTNTQSIVDASNAFIAAVQNLCEIVLPGHRPKWLEELQKVSGNLWEVVSEGTSAGRSLLIPKFLPQLLTDIVLATPKVATHQWRFEELGPFIDVDRIFEQYRMESRLGELADKLVEVIEKIAQAPAFDSARLQKSLQRIVAMLKSSKSGSWFSVLSTREYAGAYFKRFLFHLSKAAPAVGPVIEAAHETWKEFSDEVDGIQTKAREEVKRLAVEDVSQMPEWILRLTEEEIPKISGADNPQS